MLEADALQDVVQLDVHAEVVRIQLELVAGPQAALFRDIHRHGGDAAVVGNAPVFVRGGVDQIVDELSGLNHVTSAFELPTSNFDCAAFSRSL